MTGEHAPSHNVLTVRSEIGPVAPTRHYLVSLKIVVRPKQKNRGVLAQVTVPQFL